jgi:hypothetical protein
MVVENRHAARSTGKSYFVNVLRRVPAFYWQIGVVHVNAADPESALNDVRSGLASGELSPVWEPLPEDQGVELAPGDPGPTLIDIPEAIPLDGPVRGSSSEGDRQKVWRLRHSS